MTKREILRKSIKHFRFLAKVAHKEKNIDYAFSWRIARDISAQIDLLEELEIINHEKGILLNNIIRSIIFS